MTDTRLREVAAEEYQPPQATVQQQQASQASLQLLLLALKTLSQRTILAMAALRGLVLAGTVFWATLNILDNPNTYKLVGLGLYGVFVLTLEVVAYRRH